MDRTNEGMAAAIRSYCANNPKENGQALPIAEFAEKIGFNRASVINWMNGTCTPSLSDSCSICDYMGISLDELAGRTVTG